MTMLDELKRVIQASEEIEYERDDCDVARFLRVHGQALVDCVDKAAKWDMCNATFVEGDVEVRCHITVGLNEWKGDDWVGFTTCSPDELAQLTDAARAK